MFQRKYELHSRDDVSSKLVYVRIGIFDDCHYDNSKVILDYDLS